MAKEEVVMMRKGPWTEQEDTQLACFVRLLGERRWDFLAKVSGLNRTGKSCRLRWVNYLHPGLKRGRMSPDEERLVIDLHAKWGNRWSRIAKSMPGRTDNEIKNYWRTHTRKQHKSTSMSPPSTNDQLKAQQLANAHGCCCDDGMEEAQGMYTTCSMDMLCLWNDMDYVGGWSASSMPSPVWDPSDSLWGLIGDGDDQEEYKKMVDAS